MHTSFSSQSPSSPSETRRRAIIIGAGPAGLTAAYELATRTGIQPVVIEKGNFLGGISRTVQYRGNRLDIGGHRFFSKSDRVMNWWLRILPLQATGEGQASIHYHGMERSVAGDTAADSADRVMLLRPRKSRIYYLRQFFDYPIRLSRDTILKLGLWRVFRIGLSYLRSVVSPIRPEATLEQFFINRFGRELYRTFFQSYTEKVWGIPCSRISAEWGAQRIKGLSILATLRHALSKAAHGASPDLRQQNTETSLIERFLYPKFGPGQLWEEVARQVCAQGGLIRTGLTATRIETDGWRVTGVEVTHPESGQTEVLEGDYFFSTAPVRELMRALQPPPPPNVLEVSDGLVYRDFITVGLLVRSLKVHEDTAAGRKLISDNWIYIQEPDVRLGRLQVFNNWSPHMVADPNTVWLGLEYFCNETDSLWKLSDVEMADLARTELARIGLVDAGEVLDSTVVRVEKTYPAYFGTYERFAEIRAHVDRYENLFLVGRNGMHRYNNQDHSMLTAMLAVDKILSGDRDKSALWEVNTESDYHEEKNG